MTCYYHFFWVQIFSFLEVCGMSNVGKLFHHHLMLKFLGYLKVTYDSLYIFFFPSYS